ncbi:hypothetical protein MCC02033_07060 [Bifidobacteriaceae bacterium MCC02033]|nr:hypothetical protein MCC02032_04130 [Bifidobacteriaceae bacterium MCC02032]GDZ46156.1 hypothetical protein MCC02033_07060 [Bifidobacteriaceae bacterium MCC02033]GDZ50544.1 hypothetical protein MCC02034_10800 [Bifidobacteriaceae bacterium MCC02034]GDZ51696.1 hypothetical protein MCC02035_03890 [Bifidobacteriaceae bacterium MCC02035]GDZ56546.1 hypothetical protein MCC01996_12460 [Bifidobacteriaceae bacterium MCC01996]
MFDADMGGGSVEEFVTDAVDTCAGHRHVIYLVFQSTFAHAKRGVGMGEYGNHTSWFDVVLAEIECSIANRGHNGAVPVQKTYCTMLSQQCHQLDIGYGVIDSSAERAIYMEKPRMV